MSYRCGCSFLSRYIGFMFEGNILTEGGMEGNRNTILEAVLAKKKPMMFSENILICTYY